MHHTPLFPLHQAAGARCVPFAGWDMPLHYGSQLQEHLAVRQGAGIFDVSHMRVLDFQGAESLAFLRHLLANDVARLAIGQALYSCMLNPQGGILDDLIVYRVNEQDFRMVVNAGTAEADTRWIQQCAAAFAVTVTPRPELMLLAVQGPTARALVHQALGAYAASQLLHLPVFHAWQHEAIFVARTGYTGEDGYEIMLPESAGIALWQQLLALGVTPCGLGARDTLRLEAGMNLYGADMDESISPLACGLTWTLALEPADRDFIGRKALERLATEPQPRWIGVVLEDRGVLRNHMPLYAGDREVGLITSGGYSPSAQRAIGLARLWQDSGALTVDIRGRRHPLRQVPPRFVRKGQVLI